MTTFYDFILWLIQPVSIPRWLHFIGSLCVGFVGLCLFAFALLVWWFRPAALEKEEE